MASVFQTPSSSPSPKPQGHYPATVFQEDVEKPIDYKYYLSLFLKNFHILITFFMITVTFAFVYTSKLPTLYQSKAQIILERPTSPWQGDLAPNLRQDATEIRGFDEEYYTTQIAIMLGNSVLFQVVQELKLNEYFETKSDETAAEKLRAMLGVMRIERSRILEIAATSDDPKLSANIANAVSRAYIRKNFEDMLYFSREVMNWLPQEGPADEKITIKDPFGGIKQMTRQELIDSLPSIRSDNTIRGFEEKKATLESELKVLLSQYREKHPNIIKIRSNIKFITESIEAEKIKIIDGLRAKAEGRLNVSNARILDEAQIPRGPLPSTKLKIILMVSAMELLISFLIVFLFDYFDDTVRAMEDLERRGLVLPFLGPIPLIKDKTILKSKKGILALHDKQSEVAESFRYLRVSINFSASPESLKTLVFSSCLPHEGKSFTADNIAVSLALDGNKTLLVDADMRRPTLHKIFNLDNQTGLSNYLTSKLEFDSVIKQSPIEDLSLITSGPSSPNPGAILGSERMKEFLETAKEKFDRVIIDCPPLTGIGDGFVVGNLIGHIILIISSGKAPVDLIRHNQAQLAKMGVEIIGVVLNMVDMEKERYHGYTKHYYHTYTRYYHKDKEKPEE